MDCKNLSQGRGQSVQEYTQMFRKKALSLGIPLYTQETLLKYIGGLHVYLRHSILMFNPSNFDEVCVQTIAFFSEKLNDVRKNYSTQDVKFYAIVQALRHQRHYLVLKEFVFFTDHISLKYVNTKNKLNSRHKKWVSFLQGYMFVLKQKSGRKNQVVDQPTVLLTTMENQVIGFDAFKDLYASINAFFKDFMEQLKI